MTAEQRDNNAFEFIWDRQWFRFAATLAFPLVVLCAVMKALWILMPSEWFDTRTLSILDISAFKLSGFAPAIDGRMNFSIMSAAIWGAGAVACVLSFFVVWRTLCSACAAALAMVIALVLGIGVGALESHTDPTVCDSYTPGKSTVRVDRGQGFRFVVIDNVMCVAEHGLPQETRVLATAQNMILANTYIGFIGAAAVMTAFAALTLRYEDWYSVSRLRRRLDDFRTLTLMAGVLFILNALVTKALVNWTQGMLAPDDGSVASFARLGNALLNYWAAQSSMVLLATIGVAALFIQRDVNEAAKLALNEAHAPASVGNSPVVAEPVAAKVEGGEVLSETKWIETKELTFDSATVVAATLGTVAPFLAGPAVDLVTKALH